MIAITAAEYYIAQSIARQLLQENELQGQDQVRLLAREPSRCENLRRLGAQVVQVNYQDENQLQEALQQIQWLVVVVEPNEARVQGTEILIRAANRVGVRNVMVISSNAAEAQGRRLREYKQIEQRVQRELQNTNWAVLRTDLPQQSFLWVSPWVEENNKFPLPVSEKSKFPPVDVNDINRAVIQLITRGQRRIQDLEERWNRQTLNLTGPEAVDGPRIVNALNNATGRQVKFQPVTSDQFKKILDRLQDDNAYEQNVRRAEQKAQLRAQGQGRPDQHLPPAPNGIEVEDMLEIFEWVQRGNNANVSNDLQKIIGRNGNAIDQFFNENADNFRPSMV